MEDLKLFTLHCTLVKNAYYFWIQISDKDIPVELDEDTISINNERYQADTSDLRELLDKTYRDVMSGIID